MEEEASQESELRTLSPADLLGSHSEALYAAAFQLFRDMDFDSTGRIPALILRNYLCGDTTKLISSTFDHPDTGIQWKEESGVLSILSIERDSPAAMRAELVPGLVLHSLQDNAISSLHELYASLSHLTGNATAHVRFNFIVPVLIVSTFNQRLELEINSRLVAVDLPLGAVYDLSALSDTVNKQLSKVLGSHVIQLSVNTHLRQFSFKAETIFRLLFSRARSCCFLLGFDGRDTSEDYVHTGEPMTTDINLGLPESAVNLLVSHLLFALGFPQRDSHFNESEIFDPEDHVFLTFEQFRLVFVNFLCDAESINRLRAYGRAHFRRFRFKNHFNRVVTVKYERMMKKIDKQNLNAKTLQPRPDTTVTVHQTHKLDKDGVVMLPATEMNWVDRRRRRLQKRAEHRIARREGQGVQETRSE